MRRTGILRSAHSILESACVSEGRIFNVIVHLLSFRSKHSVGSHVPRGNFGARKAGAYSPARDLISSTLLVFSHVKSGSSRPKWPFADVFL